MGEGWRGTGQDDDTATASRILQYVTAEERGSRRGSWGSEYIQADQVSQRGNSSHASASHQYDCASERGPAAARVSPPEKSSSARGLLGHSVSASVGWAGRSGSGWPVSGLVGGGRQGKAPLQAAVPRARRHGGRGR